MDIRDRLQENLVLLRMCAGFTSQDFAGRLGVSRQTVSAFERHGSRLSQMQFLAIRQVFEQERRGNEMLSSVLDAVVDHPEAYTEPERREIIKNARLIAPSIMKKPEEKKTISTAWKAILVAAGIALAGSVLLRGAGKEEENG
ncbi:MAG: hypothetical protein K5746_00890 [Clostridiales bacterium]|nr:hypothetical protein [Clostridiales bacterium]